MDIKLEPANEDDIKEEQFDEDLYTASGTSQQNQQQQHHHQYHQSSDLMENLTDYSDNMSKSSSTVNKRTRKYKNKGPSVHKVDVKAKLERSRQSARECRARKKLRYQYLEDLVLKRENANLLLKKEIDQLKEAANLYTTGCPKSEIDKKLKEMR